MDRLKALEIFKAVADRGSFVKAAGALELSCAAVTRSVQDLEHLLGLRLLHRTTRQVSLTCDGEVVLRRAQGLLDAFGQIAALGHAGESEVSGRLKLLAPSALGPRFLSPLITTFVTRHPKVLVEIDMANERCDTTAAGIDLFLLLRGESVPSSYVVRHLCDLQMVMAGSNDYLRRRGQPVHPCELSGHDCLAYTGAAFGGDWRLSGCGGARHCHTPAGNISSNHGEALLAAAIQGSGLVLLPHVLVADAIATGDLRPVLSDWQAQPVALQIGYATRDHQPTRVRAMLDHLTHELRARQRHQRNNELRLVDGYPSAA